MQKVAASVEQNGELKNFMASTIGKNIQNLSEAVMGEAQGKQVQQAQKSGIKLPTMEAVIQNQAPEPPKPAKGSRGL